MGETTWVRFYFLILSIFLQLFRLYDRMRRRQVGNTFDNVWFDVDIENLARGRTNMMALILNNGSEPLDHSISCSDT